MKSSMVNVKKFNRLSTDNKTQLLLEAILLLEQTTDKRFDIVASSLKRADLNFTILERRREKRG